MVFSKECENFSFLSVSAKNWPILADSKHNRDQNCTCDLKIVIQFKVFFEIVKNIDFYQDLEQLTPNRYRLYL